MLDALYKGKVLSIFDLNSAFHQTIADPDTVPLTAFCTPTQLLYEFLRMPQGAKRLALLVREGYQQGCVWPGARVMPYSCY